jgi:hypothetical protein
MKSGHKRPKVLTAIGTNAMGSGRLAYTLDLEACTDVEGTID